MCGVRTDLLVIDAHNVFKCGDEFLVVELVHQLKVACEDCFDIWLNVFLCGIVSENLL